MLLVDALAHAGHGVRDIVEAWAAQSVVLQSVSGLVERAAGVCEGGRRAAHLGDEAREHISDGVTGPGIRHRDSKTADMRQSEGPWSALMVMGLTGQDGQYLARAQATTAVAHPDEAVGTGRLAKRHPLEPTGRCEAHEAQAHDPIDDGLWAWRLLDAQSPSQETQDATAGATAATRHEKELQGEKDQVDCGVHGTCLALGLELRQARRRLCEARWGLLERWGGAVALGADARDRWALVSIAVTSLRGCVLPLIATVCDCGALAHEALFHQDRPP
jgi:hypothetical protein